MTTVPFSTTLSYSTTDRDRICRVAFGASNGTACNVTYDELGGILSQPTPTGTRQYTYLVNNIVLPLLGFDLAYGIEGHSPEIYFEVGLTDF